MSVEAETPSTPARSALETPDSFYGKIKAVRSDGSTTREYKGTDGKVFKFPSFSSLSWDAFTSVRTAYRSLPVPAQLTLGDKKTFYWTFTQLKDNWNLFSSLRPRDFVVNEWDGKRGSNICPCP